MSIVAELARQVLEQAPDAALLAAPADADAARDPRLSIRPGADLDALLTAAGTGPVVLIEPPARLADGALVGLADKLEADLGVGSIGFVTEGVVAACTRAVGRDEPPVTPRPADVEPFSVPWCRGPVVALGRGALSRVSALPAGATLDDRLRAWSAAVGARAFCHLLDPGRVVLDAAEPAEAVGEVLDDGRARDAARRIVVRHHGLRVHVDGRTFEGAQTGTEVHALGLIGALAERPEITYLGVNLRGEVPPYARAVLESGRVTVHRGCGEWRSDLPRVDVVHRPYQPLSAEDVARWRDLGARTVCTVQDLITYLGPEYHPSVAAWRDARTRTQQALAAVDAVLCISDHVRDQVRREGLCRSDEVLWTYHCGVDHLGGLEEVAAPEVLAGETRPFALVLASSYGHKNHDLAVEAVRELRRRGRDLLAVVAGRPVDVGGIGAETDDADGAVVALGRNVPVAERNWLLGNAAVLLNPTSAEGFGFTPFEAAALGTPSVQVLTGAQGEVLGPLPVAPDDWSVRALVAAVEALLDDPGRSAAQVAAVRASARRLTWASAAAVVLQAYEAVLGRPARV